MRRWLLVLAAMVAAWAAPSNGLGSAPQPAAELPPLSYACPMHPDVVEDRPGTCPRCGMPLEAVRLGTAYSCPLHPFVVEPHGGACRVCRRQLVPITVALTFGCGSGAADRTLAPGLCADGSPRVPVRERRAHGDHNPRHGGIFFMAPDNWHHIEGTYVSPGVIRVYVYDDFTRPLPAAMLRQVHASAVVSNKAIGSVRRAAAAPLLMSKDRQTLEAAVRIPLPASIAVEMAFAPGEAAHRFDFTFATYTSDEKRTTRVGAAPAGESRTAAHPPGDDLLDQLANHRRAVDAAVASGAYGAVYIPALAAKDVALEIEAGGRDRSNAAEIATAVKQIVVAAWLLDAYGDLGDRDRIEQAHAAFDAAVDALVHANVR